MRYRIAISMIMLLMTHTVMALDNQFMVWTQYKYAGRFEGHPKIKREFETQLRFSHNGNNELDAVRLRGGLGYEVKPAVLLLAGYEWILGFRPAGEGQFTVGHENIIYEQQSWSASPSINFRSRLEQRQRTTEDAWNVRWRFKTVYVGQTPLFFDFQPLISDEVFLLFNHPNWVTSSTFDQNRLFVGFQVRMTHTLWWQLGYMNQYIESNHSAESQMNHIAYFSLSYL